MNRFDKYYVNKAWTKLFIVVSSGPARWSNPTYPDLKEYGINEWQLNEDKSCGSFLASPHWTDLDFIKHDLIEFDKETFNLLYRR